MDELEAICQECNGKGTYLKEVSTWSMRGKRLKDKKQTFSCNACNGSGKTPTELGLSILAFIEKYQDFNTKVQGIIDEEFKHRDCPKYHD